MQEMSANINEEIRFQNSFSLSRDKHIVGQNDGLEEMGAKVSSNYKVLRSWKRMWKRILALTTISFLPSILLPFFIFSLFLLLKKLHFLNLPFDSVLVPFNTSTIFCAPQ